MFQTIIIIPLTNALIGLTSFLWGNLGLAVIALTILVKLVLYPFSFSSTKHQIALKKLQPLLDEIKKKYPDKNEQAKRTMELYKEHKANPLAGCLPILIQIPLIIGLYQVFLKGTTIDATILYSFITAPETISSTLVGIDLTSKSVLFALLAGITQYVQLKLSPMNIQSEESKSGDKDPQTEMMENMQKMMKYFLPIMITIFAFVVPAAVALYWIITNLFTIGQEMYIYKQLHPKVQ